MELIDVHCHLESDFFSENLSKIIDDAKKIGIIRLITSSITPDQWEQSQKIKESYDEVEFSLGIHPWYISENDFIEIDKLKEAKSRGAVAIGEIGLDRKINHMDFEIQLKFFEAQLRIAREINLPVIMHCRGAYNELVQSLKKIGMPEAGGIIHSFSGSAEIAEILIPLGVSFSLGGILTYKNSKKRIKLLHRIYPDHFLLETDSPDIPPVQKEKPNVPANITYNLKAAAEILGEQENDVASTTTSNAKKICQL